MDPKNHNYNHITLEDKVLDVINHPAFNGFGFYLFPWNDKKDIRKI